MDPNNDDEALAQLNAQVAPAEDAVELRCNVEFHWPEALDGDDSTSGFIIRKAHEAARDLFAQYRATRSLNAKDTRFTPQGALEADRAWVSENLPRLTKHAEALGREIDSLGRAMERLMGDLAKRPDDPMEFEELKEVREWLGRIPEADRSDKLALLVRQGDMKVLRAVLTAPVAAMTGIQPEMLSFIKEDVARASDPAKFAKIEALRKAQEAAAKAVEGVSRYLAHDTGPDGLHSRAALGRPGLRRVS
jgi:hypothetical protein